MSEYALDRTCDKYGCAKLALDPKLELFNDCFGGKIRMGDVDGAVERNGHILWLEWKLGVDFESFEKTHQAQIIQARAFTRNSEKQRFWFVVGEPLFVNGEMDVRHIRFMHAGNWRSDWLDCDFTGLKSHLRRWYQMAEKEGGAKVSHLNRGALA